MRENQSFFFSVLKKRKCALQVVPCADVLYVTPGQLKNKCNRDFVSRELQLDLSAQMQEHQQCFHKLLILYLMMFIDCLCNRHYAVDVPATKIRA